MRQRLSARHSSRNRINQRHIAALLQLRRMAGEHGAGQHHGAGACLSHFINQRAQLRKAGLRIGAELHRIHRRG
jgi:hypothetical protein